MDLTKLANLGEFIGGIAVLVTLVYLTFQVRHTTKAIQANSAQTFATLINEANYIPARDPERARISRLCFEDPEGRVRRPPPEAILTSDTHPGESATRV